MKFLITENKIEKVVFKFLDGKDLKMIKKTNIKNKNHQVKKNKNHQVKKSKNHQVKKKINKIIMKIIK